MKWARRVLFTTAACALAAAGALSAWKGDWLTFATNLPLLVGLPILYRASL